MSGNDNDENKLFTQNDTDGADCGDGNESGGSDDDCAIEHVNILPLIKTNPKSSAQQHFNNLSFPLRLGVAVVVGFTVAFGFYSVYKWTTGTPK